MKKWMKILILLFISHLTIIAEDILILSNDAKITKEAINGFKLEIQESYTVREHLITEHSDLPGLLSEIKSVKPKIVLLVDNAAIRLMKQYYDADQENHTIPSIAIMGLSIEREIKGYQYICGIAYEVPGFSVITKYREKINQKINKIIVFYRESEHKDFIEDAKTQLKEENVELVAVNVESFGKSKIEVTSYIKKNLKKEIIASKADALWLLPDNGLINDETIYQWVAASRNVKMPFVTGVKKFSEEKIDFCSFSVAPNLHDLGEQTADIIYRILEEEVLAKDVGVEYLISVESFANVDKLKKMGYQLKHELGEKIEVDKE